ncbi:Phosphate-specific transport system accessory protein PhoU homolog [uncultured Gammaproteobacteria bacterium]
MTRDHIVKSFSVELRNLTNLIARMGGAAEAQIDAVIQAVVKRDIALAERVIKGDVQLDTYERDVDAEAIRLLALRQPMAQDLREILSALKVAADLERIGDHAANIAKRSLVLSQLPMVRPAAAIPRMGRLVSEILKDVLDAYTDRDLARATAAWRRDEELDELHTSLFREVLTYMMEDPRTITPCTHLLFMAKNLERIGDHATNIAETIHFMVVGAPPTEARPKGDRSSLAIAGGEVGGEVGDEAGDEAGEHAT